jgi:hypothetical protein
LSMIEQQCLQTTFATVFTVENTTSVHIGLVVGGR